MYLVLIPHCMTEILAKECKSGKSTVLTLGTVLRKGSRESSESNEVNVSILFQGCIWRYLESIKSDGLMHF